MSVTTLLAPLRFAFCIVWTVVWISLAIVASCVCFDRRVGLSFQRRFWAPGINWGAGIKLHVEPLPDVDWSTPHIFMMNHQSALDIPCVVAALPADLRFVAKHQLSYVPFLNVYMLMTGQIFINRSNRRAAMRSLRRAGERVRAGSNILAYPEGTRSKTGHILPFKKGPFALAMEARVPIIPVAIEGTMRVMKPGSLAPYGGTARLKLGRPISTDRVGVTRDALLREVRDAIVRLHEDLGGFGGTEQAVAVAGEEGVHLP